MDKPKFKPGDVVERFSNPQGLIEMPIGSKWVVAWVDAVDGSLFLEGDQQCIKRTAWAFRLAQPAVLESAKDMEALYG